MECFYIRRAALQNMQKAHTLTFTVWTELNWTELSYCLLRFKLTDITRVQSWGKLLFVSSSHEAFPGFATKRRKNSMDDDNTTPLPNLLVPQDKYLHSSYVMLCAPHKLKTCGCQSDHPLGCKLCMYFLSETFGHLSRHKVHMNNTIHWLSIVLCVLHFQVWSFVWTLILLFFFFFSCSFADKREQEKKKGKDQSPNKKNNTQKCKTHNGEPQ